MKFNFPNKRVRGYRVIALQLALLFIGSPTLAQQPGGEPTTAQRQPAKPPDPTFETLLATDAYKLYGEVRNVGQLLSTGGAGEIIEPVIKLADPGQEFKSVVNFLKKHSEALANSRLMFATWPARTDVPTMFTAIEFPTNEDATKFAPSLEKFLPTLLPPVPVNTEQITKPGPSQGSTPPPETKPKPSNGSVITEETLPFVITRSANLIFISDKPFKFEKLHPVASKSLFQDQNFRLARDKFTPEPVFLFFNVALEDKTKPQPSPKPGISDEEAARRKAEDTDESPHEPPKTDPAMMPSPEQQAKAVLIAAPEPSPTPTPTKEQEAQAVASVQVGQMLDMIGIGEPQWPEAVGMAFALDGNEYVVKAILIDKPDAKLLPIPFVPQLIGGPPYNAEASSVLPDDTEMFVSASIDLTQTYEGMRKQAEIRAKNEAKASIYVRGQVVVSQRNEKEPEQDVFTQFEKKAGFKFKDDLLPALGSEIAIAGSIKTLEGAGGFRFGAPTAKPSPDPNDPNKKETDVVPIILIGMKDRDAMRRLMPKVLVGLGIGEANLLAQTEKRGDAEIVNYANMFAYGFVGDFIVISDTAGVRRVADANENHQTLSSNTVYRNSRRWEPSRTLGQVYISPALMEGYHEQIRKQAATLEPAMRDFLLSLNPKSEAITYALSNDGLGTNHELHLPKNLILTMVAGISSSTKNPPPEANEMFAISALQVIASNEQQYKAGSTNGPYGTMKELTDAKLFPFPPQELDRFGYNFEITVMGDQFEAVATPKEYGKTGKRSFFVDKSGVVRGGDHGGGPATIADKPVEP